MTTWQIKVEVRQGLHNGGTKFYRGIFIYGLAQLHDKKTVFPRLYKYPIVSMTSWAAAKPGWKENYDLGQMTLDSINSDFKPPSVSMSLHESWLKGELYRKRKNGYDIGPLPFTHVIEGDWVIARLDLTRLIGKKRTDPIWDRVTLLKSKLERENIFYGKFSTAEVKAATAVSIKAASEESEGWGSW